MEDGIKWYQRQRHGDRFPIPTFIIPHNPGPFLGGLTTLPGLQQEALTLFFIIKCWISASSASEVRDP